MRVVAMLLNVTAIMRFIRYSGAAIVKDAPLSAMPRHDYARRRV